MRERTRQTHEAQLGWSACWVLVAAIATAVGGCGDESKEPARVTLPVVVDSDGIGEATTDLGYAIELQMLRMVVVDLELTTAGETHASNDPSWLQRLFVPAAYAHPGHYAGGDVIGELRGRWVVDWVADDGVSLGDATLLAGDYNGANFTFGSASTEDGLTADDDLLGGNAEILGTAARDGGSVVFHAVVQQDEDRQLVGAPFDLDVQETTVATLGLQCRLVDPVEGDTLFDGIDFFALDDGEGRVELEPDSPDYNRLRRSLQVHDHYFINVR